MDTPNAWSILTSIASMVVVWFDLIKSALSSLAWPATVLTGIFVFRKDVVALLSKLASIKAGGVEAQFAHEVHQLNPLASSAEAEAEVAADAVADVGDETQGHTDQVNDDHRERDVGVDTSEADAQPGEADGTEEPLASPRRREATETWKYIYDHLKESTERSPSNSFHDFASNFRDYVLRKSIDGAAAKDLEEARVIAANSPSGAVLLAWRAVEGILQQLPAEPHTFFVKSKFIHRWKSPTSVMRNLVTSSLIDTETYIRFYELQKLRNSVAHANQFTAAPADVLEFINRAEELAITLTSVVTRLAVSKPPKPALQDDPGPAGIPTQPD